MGTPHHAGADEQHLIRSLLAHELAGLEGLPYLFQFCWTSYNKHRPDWGHADLVLTNGYGVFLVMQVREASGLCAGCRGIRVL